VEDHMGHSKEKPIARRSPYWSGENELTIKRELQRSTISTIEILQLHTFLKPCRKEKSR
jgi:hypothetical protein